MHIEFFRISQKKRRNPFLYRITGKLLPNDPEGRRIPIRSTGSYSLPNDQVPRTLYLQRVHDFIGTEGILHVAGIVALVSSLHVPQRQRVVRPDVRPVVKNPDVIITRTYTYLSYSIISLHHLLLLQLDVASTPFHRGTWNTDGETGHIDVHPPRHYERHSERYYSCWN